MGFGSSIGGMIGGAGGNVVGGALVRLTLDSAQFDTGLKSSQGKLMGAAARMHRIAGGMNKVGSSLTRGVTVPLLAIGAASVKIAMDFNTAFTRIRANSNLTEKEIASLKKTTLELAGETGKSPRELAEALYFLASAGLTAKQVQETLTMSAKASAAGFGVTADIARLTANALNAYAKEGLRAKEVTDTLAAGIREGTAEPDEFANALGRILPVAQKAGVGFDEVVASLASLSSIGLDVNEGVTAMRGLMMSLEAPTQKAKDTLKDLGLTADDVRRSLAEDGLLATMRMLEDQTGGDIDKLSALVGNVRALTGLFGITGQKADKVSGSFERVIGASGDLDTAFKKTEQDAGFKFQKMLAKLEVAAIDLGTKLLPVAEDIMKWVGDLAESFSNMDPELQEAIIKWGALAVAMGPVLKILSGITSIGANAAKIISTIAAKGVAASAAGSAASAAGTAAGAAGTAAAAAGAAGTAAAGAGAAGTGAAIAGGSVAGPVIAGMAILGGAGIAFAKIAGDQSEATRKAAREITKYGVRSEQAAAALETLGLSAEELLNAENIDKLERQGKSYDSLSASEFYAAQAADVLLKKHKEYVQHLTGAGLASVRAYDDVTEGAVKLTDKQRVKIAALVGAHEKLGIRLDANARKTTNNLLQVGDFDGALKNLKESLREGGQEVGAFGKRSAESGGKLAGMSTQAELGAAKVRGLRSDLSRVPKLTRAEVRVETRAAQVAINSIVSGLLQIPRNVFSTVTVTTVGSGTYGNKVLPRAKGGPVLAGQSYLVGEYGPELLRMRQRGDVISNDQLRRAGAVRGSDDGVGEPMQINLILDGTTLASYLTRHQKRYDIVLGGKR